MNIGELFVNLGITGSEQTVGALGSVKKGLGEVSSMSLEAKAAILAALYGLERMAAVSGATGTSLTNFAALTGLLPEKLQRWQYAARQAGVANEDLTGSLKSVQNAMTETLLKGNAPSGLQMVAKTVGFDERRMRDTFYVMEQLQKAAQALPKDVGNNVLKSFGLSEGTIAAMRRNAFNPAIMARAPLYSEKEINSLNKSNIAWSNLGTKIEMAFGRFNAKHGQSLVNDIGKIIGSVEKLAEALVKLSEKLKIFEALAKAAGITAQVLEGWGLIVDDISGKTSDQHKKTHPQLPRGLTTGAVPNVRDLLDLSLQQSLLHPTHTEHMTINQNITHHGDAKDTKAVKDTYKSAVNQAYRLRSSQRKGS